MTKSADMATLLDSNSKVPGADIASGSVTVSTISATGTPSASTFLRGDGSWNAPAGGVTSLTAGSGITVSASTGAVTVSQDFYTGTTVNNTSYPIGSYIGVTTIQADTNVNVSKTIYSPPSAGGPIFDLVSLGTGSAALTGTWRSRGKVMDRTVGCDVVKSYVFQRTA